MNKVTSMTMFETSAGPRLSITYSEISEDGRILKSNIRVDRILVKSELITHTEALKDYAQSVVNDMEEAGTEG